MPAEERTHIAVEGGAMAARRLRGELTRVLADTLSAPVLGDVLLAVTELAANAVVHGGVDEDGAIEVAVVRADGRVRVEVRDSGRQGQPSPRPPDLEHGGGFGLQLVGALSTAWGVEHDPRLCVWFELDAGAATRRRSRRRGRAPKRISAPRG